MGLIEFFDCAALVLPLVVLVVFIVWCMLKKRHGELRIILLELVVQAEKQLGSETGRLKRAKVYTWLTIRFPVLMLFMSEKRFDKMLDMALGELKRLLACNESIKHYVEEPEESELP